MHLPVRAARALCLAVLATVCPALPAEDARVAATLETILACNAEALGGDTAFERIDNLRIALDIAEPGFEVTASYVASRDGRMRIDIEAEGRRVFAEGLDDAGAWQWTPDGGVRRQGADGAAALRNGVEAPGRFWTLRQLRDRGARVELLEPGPLAGAEEWQLRLTQADGTAVDHFLDRASCLPTREVSRRAFHPDVDPTESLVETAHGEPFRADGVLRFRRGESRDLESAAWLGTTLLRSVEHNVELPPGFFEAR
jgi:hypothetical protein